MALAPSRDSFNFSLATDYDDDDDEDDSAIYSELMVLSCRKAPREGRREGGAPARPTLASRATRTTRARQ